MLDMDMSRLESKRFAGEGGGFSPNGKSGTVAGLDTLAGETLQINCVDAPVSLVMLSSFYLRSNLKFRRAFRGLIVVQRGGRSELGQLMEALEQVSERPLRREDRSSQSFQPFYLGKRHQQLITPPKSNT